MALQLPAVAFIPLGPPDGGAKGGAKAGGKAGGKSGGGRGRGPAQPVLTPGEPLPEKGTCRHYRHSYRWLRFPCCGARYACDLCHEEAADHPMKWATRMVCGFCSIEQPVAAECCACGRKLATSAKKPSGRNTRFWEGGQGCRDLKRLNRNDPHKYRNSRAKTQSAKHTRVGPKAQRGQRRRSDSSG